MHLLKRFFLYKPSQLMHLVMRLFYYDACNLAFVDASIFLLLRLYNSSIQLPATQSAGRAGKHSSSTVKEKQRKKAPRGKKDAPTFKSLRSPHKFWQRAVSYLDQCDQSKSIGVVGLLTNINISDQTMSRTCTKNKQLPLSMLICMTQATLMW